MKKTITVPLTSKNSVHIVQGDLIHSDDELLVIPVYPSNHDLYLAIKTKYHQINQQERIITSFWEDGHISIVDAGSRKLMYVYLPFFDGKVSITSFEQVIQSIFSSLMMLQFEGMNFKKISMPFLGERLVEKKDRLDMFKMYLSYVEKSEQYIEQSLQFTFYTLREEEYKKIEALLLQTLSKTVQKPFPKQVVYKYKDRYTNELKKYSQDKILSQIAELIMPPKLDANTFFHIDRARSHLLQLLYKELLPSFQIRYKLRYPTKEFLALNYFPQWYMSYFNYIDSLKVEGPLTEQSIERQILYFAMNERLLQSIENIKAIQGAQDDKHPY